MFMIKVVMIFNIKFDLEKKTYLETNLAKTPLQPSSILASEEIEQNYVRQDWKQFLFGVKNNLNQVNISKLLIKRDFVKQTFKIRYNLQNHTNLIYLKSEA